ncbi:MAG: UbiD family decarboxylase [Chloroflexi bacterium]|nr:UbiD family decarboxylase [Chloroflexota bacterium]
MAYRDVREWIEQVDAVGELTRIEGAHWDLEASAVCAVSPRPVLFDRFPGYPPGFRLLARKLDAQQSRKVFFITAGWSSEAEGVALTKAWLDRLRQFRPVPPEEVSDGPILENVLTGDDIDVLRFPVPRGYVLDAGRYVGTGHCVIVKDPDDGRINLGTYRMQVHDKASTGMFIIEGQDGQMIVDKYHQRGQPCPMVAVVGIDPGLFMASTYRITHIDGAELDFAGWLKGCPEQLVKGEYTGLPMPARAEIALEGEVSPGDTRTEAPFAEWTGFCQATNAPVFRIKAIYHRNDPILTVSLGREVYPPGKGGIRGGFTGSALVWDQMERAGVRGIKGVSFSHGGRLMVVSIKNSYAGHSKQAGLVASQTHAGGHSGGYVIVVDEDIDPSNLSDVMWAIIMRTNPARAVQVLEHCWGSQTTLQDPSRVQPAPYAMRPEKATYNSFAIIDACKPLEWDPSWHQEVRISSELKQQVLSKWGDVLRARPE